MAVILIAPSAAVESREQIIYDDEGERGGGGCVQWATCSHENAAGPYESQSKLAAGTNDTLRGIPNNSKKSIRHSVRYDRRHTCT